ncbi:hypothetical protein V8C26DRAFT_413816 [Trichoderma gracile]
MNISLVKLRAAVPVSHVHVPPESSPCMYVHVPANRIVGHPHPVSPTLLPAAQPIGSPHGVLDPKTNLPQSSFLLFSSSVVFLIPPPLVNVGTLTFLILRPFHRTARLRSHSPHLQQSNNPSMGDFWGRLAQELARLQEEAAKHVTPENINRAAQAVRDGVGHAVEQVNQHVTPENIERGADMVRNGIGMAAEQAQKHITQENIHHGLRLAGDGLKHATDQIHRHINQENINHASQMAGNVINGAAQHIREHVTKENIQGAAEKLGKTAQETAQGPVGQKVAAAMEQNKVPLAVTAAGILVAAAPGIITAPILGVAHLLGFTSSGVAAASVAAGTQAGIGSVAAGSGFAVMQSAAAGGYGMAIITGIVQAVGGVTAAVGGIAGVVARAVG